MATLEATHESEEQRDDTPLVQLEADIDSDGSFGRRSLEITKDQVRVLDHDGTLAFQMPISEIKTARNEPLVGGGRLEITAKTGEILPIISYSQAVAAQFSEAARGIEQLAKGEPLLISLKTEQTNCPKCGRLLPEKDGVCPACVNRGRTLLRIAGFLKPYRLQAALLTTCSILTTLANLIPPQIVGNLVNGILSSHHTLHHLYQLMALWGGVIVFGSMIQIVNGRLIAFLAANIAADLRSQLYRAIEYLQVSYFDKKQVGAISSRVTQDTDRVWGFLVDGLPFLVINSLMLIGVIGFLLQISVKLTLAIIAPIPIVMLISIVFWRPMSTMFTRVGQKWARFHTLLNESLSGVRVMKAFAQEDLEFDRFAQRNNELRDAAVAADSRWSTIFGAMSLFTSIGTLICWSVGGPMVYRHEITLGDLIKVTAYLNLIYGPLQWFAQVNNWFSRAMAGAERIFEIMDMEKEGYAKQDAKIHAIEGTVEFSNIRFGYDKSNPVLKNLSFTAKPGEMIGLVGKSGAGKSTTINLICRFYEPDAGTLTIDGIDYRDLDLQDLRRQIGLVLQEPFLFNGTIWENIAYGKPGADFDDVIEAAKAANAHNFILAKPDGYDTMVGERGAKLSGGERQRISIARAILHNPRILILDEATSSVDVETEKQIQEAIGRLTAGRTTFAIAHRLSTLRNADRLIVLDKGEIAEIGTHAELMEKKGEFFKLVETQSQVTQIIGLAE